MRFNWDQNKASSNLKKHKVSFEEASSTFWDENALLIPDPEHSFDEKRFVLLGVSRKFRLLLVSHCYRDNDEQVRIISARKATKNEHKQYEGKL